MGTRPRVVLAGCAKLPASDGDDTALPAALDEVGVAAHWAAWDDPNGGFTGVDLVVLRATWDYTWRRVEFLDWCESIPVLANPARVVRWNTDKRYLADLLAGGLPVVPTQLVGVHDLVDWPDTEFVLKPSVGAGSRGAARFSGTDLDAARAHLRLLHDDGRLAVLQPYQSAVDRQGETAVVFAGGTYSHAFAKAPALVDPAALETSELFGTQSKLPVQPPADLRELAEDAMDVAAGLFGAQRAELLYARVDLVRGPGGAPLLLELELTEPSLGFRHAEPAAALRFASAVRAVLDRGRTRHAR